jgi:peptidoglycan/LPS O-acetylase OafA/YrhL
MNNLNLHKRIAFLDWMRVFAFSSVVVGHLFNENFRLFADNSQNYLLFRQVAQAVYDFSFVGGAGVLLFFLTSGYIISHVLINENCVEFVIRRIFRIYPLFVVAVILEFCANTIYANSSWSGIFDIWPRLILLGDFFGIPYSLSGVEWTLRIELVFYIFMAFLKASGIFGRFVILPYVYLFSGVLLAFYVTPFPSAHGWSNGYLNMFFPFLLVGSLFYFYEKGLVNKFSCIFSGILMICFSMMQIPLLKPQLNNSNFEAIALVIFWIFWVFRDKIPTFKIVTALSEMTYAVYLFHLWTWGLLIVGLSRIGIQFIPLWLQGLFALMVISYAMTITVERWGIKFGREINNMVKDKILRLEFLKKQNS